MITCQSLFKSSKLKHAFFFLLFYARFSPHKEPTATVSIRHIHDNQLYFRDVASREAI
jgi:hypothetical protein